MNYKTKYSCPELDAMKNKQRITEKIKGNKKMTKVCLMLQDLYNGKNKEEKKHTKEELKEIIDIADFPFGIHLFLVGNLSLILELNLN
jgi:hypothetical protein